MPDFTFRVTDSASSALAGISRGFKATDDEIKKADFSIQRLAHDLGGLDVQFGPLVASTRTFKTEWKELGQVIRTVGAGIQIAQTGLNLLTNIGQKAWDAGAFAVDALAFKESTLASFQLILGTKEEAKNLFSEAVTFGSKTPFETEDVIKSFKSLLSAGFSKTEVPIVFQAVGDVSAASGFDKGILERLALAFGQIKSAGHLMGQDFRQVYEATAGAGVGVGSISTQIGKLMGIKPTAVAKAISGGLVDSQTAIFAILKAIEERGGGLGNVMKTQSTTINGLLSTIRSIPKDLFFGFDLDKFKGLESFRSSLQNITEIFSATSVTGKELQGIVEGITESFFNTFFGDFGGEGGKSTLEAVMKSFIATMKGVDWKEVFGDMKSALEAIWTVAKGVATALGAIHTFAKAVGYTAAEWSVHGIGNNSDDEEKRIYNAALGRGQATSKGMADGVDWGRAAVGDASRGVASEAQDGITKPLQIQSPSRVMQGYGEHIAHGLALGISGGADDVADATTGLFGPIAHSGAGASAPGAGMSIQVTFNLEAQGESNEGLAARVRESLGAALVDAVKQAAVEFGEA